MTSPAAGPVITAERVGKTFGEERREGLLGFFGRKRDDERRQKIVALRNVSLTFEPGKIYGVIGSNGAGKTTLLRILGRVLPPSAGRVVGRGKVAGLFGADQFIDGGQTGRNNIYNQARLLGWRDREIAPRIAEIAEFAGLNKFIDVKVARYSRGMQVRLNFSIAANLRPDILLLDEALAVGDRAFQSEALSRLRALANGGAAVVLVSHDMNHITRLCDEVVSMRGGEIVNIGPPEKVVPSYLSSLFSARSKDFGPRAENDMGRIFELRLLDGNGRPLHLMTDDKDLTVEIGYLAARPAGETRAGVGVYHEGRLLFLSERTFETSGMAGPLWFSVRVPGDLLSHRAYELNVSIRTARGAELSLAKVAPAALFKVLGSRIAEARPGGERGEPVTGALFRTAYPWTVRPMTGAGA